MFRLILLLAACTTFAQGVFDSKPADSASLAEAPYISPSRRAPTPSINPNRSRFGMDTVISISVVGTDTTKTITIYPRQDISKAEGSLSSIATATGFIAALLVVQSVVLGIAMFSN